MQRLVYLIDTAVVLTAVWFLGKLILWVKKEYFNDKGEKKNE